MTEKNKMLSGELYNCGDVELITRWHKAKALIKEYNNTDSVNRERLDEILNQLLGGRGKNLWIAGYLSFAITERIFTSVITLK